MLMKQNVTNDVTKDSPILYDVRCPEFQGFVHIFRLAAIKRLRLRRNNKTNSKISSSSDELESCSLGASISHVQWSLNIVRVRIRVISWRKCSRVHKVIQHVKYLAPMARVAKCIGNDTAH